MSVNRQSKIVDAVACYRTNIRWMRKIGGSEIVQKAEDTKIDAANDDSTVRHASLCIGTGNADDIGETWLCVGTSASRDGPLLIAGAELVLGVGGPPPGVGTFPMNQEGTQPRSPPSSLTAYKTNRKLQTRSSQRKRTYDQWLYRLNTLNASSLTRSNSSSPFFL